VIVIQKNLTYSNHLILNAEPGRSRGAAKMGVYREQLELYLNRMEEELDRTVIFWLENSKDVRNG